jgi:hypothetical protein
MSDHQPQTLLAQVVRLDVLPGPPGHPSQRVLTLWAPQVQQRFDLRLRALPLPGSDLALQDAFPIGAKVLLTVSADRVLQVKPLISSQLAGD